MPDVPNVTDIERKDLTKGDQVAVTVQSPWKSTTIVLNGIILIATMVVSVLDILSGQNLLQPIVAVFFPNDPTVATHVLTTISQIYSVLNIVLRYKTQSPVALPNAMK